MIKLFVFLLDNPSNPFNTHAPSYDREQSNGHKGVTITHNPFKFEVKPQATAKKSFSVDDISTKSAHGSTTLQKKLNSINNKDNFKLFESTSLLPSLFDEKLPPGIASVTGAIGNKADKEKTRFLFNFSQENDSTADGNGSLQPAKPVERGTMSRKFQVFFINIFFETQVEIK